MNSNDNNTLSAHNESHNLCNPHPVELYKYSYWDMLECWNSARENLVRWGVDDGTDKPGFSTWIKEFHSKKDNLSPLTYEDVSKLIRSDKPSAKFFMTGSVPVETYNTHSYVNMTELTDEEQWCTRCENCDELAYDGRICHNCGAKDIGE